jgi:hypothetical protein
MHPEQPTVIRFVACDSVDSSVESASSRLPEHTIANGAALQQVGDMKRVQQRLKDRTGTGGEGGEGALV